MNIVLNHLIKTAAELVHAPIPADHITGPYTVEVKDHRDRPYHPAMWRGMVLGVCHSHRKDGTPFSYTHLLWVGTNPNKKLITAAAHAQAAALTASEQA